MKRNISLPKPLCMQGLATASYVATCRCNSVTVVTVVRLPCVSNNGLLTVLICICVSPWPVCQVEWLKQKTEHTMEPSYWNEMRCLGEGDSSKTREGHKRHSGSPNVVGTKLCAVQSNFFCPEPRWTVPTSRYFKSQAHNNVQMPHLISKLKNCRSQWPRGLKHENFRPLKHWDRGFESLSKHGSMSAFLLCLCCPVHVAALRQADPPSKEPYRLCITFIVPE
jgi:hypothetical protein